MNVTCDQCGKKYVISDEKLGGKTVFKVRCKQCSHLISVNLQVSSSTPAPQAPPAPIPTPTTGPQWFAMVGGQQEGPFDFDQLFQRANAREITPRTHVWRAGMASWSRVQDVPELASLVPTVSAIMEPPPPPEPAKPRAPERPLDGLFGDDSAAPAAAAPAAQAPASFDPFAALGATDGDAPMGETTRSFLIASGANKRNPPWKIALFALAFVGGPLLLVYLLNTFEIVKLPTVTRTNEQGEEVQESFFSAGGAEGLKDLLTGDGAKKKAEAARLAAEEAKRRAIAAKKATEPEVVKPKVQDPSLAAFYGDTGLKTSGPKVRKTGEDTGTSTQVNSAGLSQEAVSKVVADKQKAFQTCIDNALRRNPNLAVGNVTVVLTVGPSGAVKAAGIDPKKHEISDWGQCMMSAGKRIVFPGSDAETQLELPFKVGVAVAP